MGGCTQLDTKFNEVIIESKNASCRACANFIRVRHNTRNAHHMRGFCQLGGDGEGEFNLYHSSSGSHTCKSLIIDDYNLETKHLEDEIQSEILDLREKIHNTKSKEHKIFKEFYEKSKEAVCKDKVPKWEYSILMGLLEEGAAFYEWYYSINVEKFSKLYKRRALNKNQYALLMTNIIQSVSKKCRENDRRKRSEVRGVYIDAANRKIKDPIDYLISASKSSRKLCIELALSEERELLQEANQLQSKITAILSNKPIEEWESARHKGYIETIRSEHPRPFGMVGARGDASASPAGSVLEDYRKEVP